MSEHDLSLQTSDNSSGISSCNQTQHLQIKTHFSTVRTASEAERGSRRRSEVLSDVVRTETEKQRFCFHIGVLKLLNLEM